MVKACQEENLYKYNAVPPQESQGLETRLANEVDDPASRAYKVLIEEGPEALSGKQRKDWAIFINSLINREPNELKEKQKLGLIAREKVLNESFLPGGGNLFRELFSPELSKDLTLGVMFREIANNEEFTNINNSVWFTISLIKFKFLTLCRPVLQITTNGHFLLLQIPISPNKVFFAARDERSVEIFNNSDEFDLVKWVNSPLVIRYANTMKNKADQRIMTDGYWPDKIFHMEKKERS